LIEQTLLDMARSARESREHALIEAKRLVNAAKAEINRILDSAKREKNRKATVEIATLEAGIAAELGKVRPESVLDLDSLQPGDHLFIHLLGRNATLVSIDRKHERFRINAGKIELEVPFGGASVAREEKKPAKTIRRSVSAPATSEENELNLIGCRVDEAMTRLEKFIDDAMLKGSSELRIIHGKGTGALLRGVREQLSRMVQIESFRPGEAFEGGDGVTVITMRE
jgi:DNA mismatch repair protein MutS2